MGDAEGVAVRRRPRWLRRAQPPAQAQPPAHVRSLSPSKGPGPLARRWLRQAQPPAHVRSLSLSKGPGPPCRRKGLGIHPPSGVHWAHAIDLEGRPDLRPRQRAREGVLRDRGPRRLAAPGAQRGRRAHPLSAHLRDRRRGRALPGHRPGLRRRRADGGAHEGRPGLAAQRTQPRDRGRRVRAQRAGRPAHARQGLLPRARLVVAQGLRAAAQDARADRSHGDRPILPPPEDASRRPARPRRRARAADAAVGRRGARSRVPGA